MKPVIKVWRFHEAPEEYRRLSQHGGDEDWLALVPDSMAQEYIRWIEECNFDNSVSRETLPSGEVVVIGAHA